MTATCSSNCQGYWSTWVKLDLDKKTRVWKTPDKTGSEPAMWYCGRKPCQQICTAVDRKNREDKAAAKKDTLDAKVAKPKHTPKRQAQGSAQNAVKPMVNQGRVKKEKASQTGGKKTTRAAQD